MSRCCLLISIFLSLDIFAQAQKIQMLISGQPSSIRGLSAVSDRIIWVSGSGGTVGLSTDAGNSWKWILVPGYEKSDFRDIEAFSAQEAVIMGITEPAIILRTADGGNTWNPVFRDTAKSAFLDAMDFFGDLGVAIGDPDGGKILFATTQDRGKSWEMPSSSGLDTTSSGEAFFAASGSNIRLLSPNQWVLVSGGKKSRLYLGNKCFSLLLNQGGETTGANAIALSPADPNKAFVVGGDFSHDTLGRGNSLMVQLSPFHQQLPITPPRGYRSCVEYLNDQKMICCGTCGVDVSKDGGLNWKGISSQSFHICRKAKSGKTIFLAGSRGTVARLNWD